MTVSKRNWEGQLDLGQVPAIAAEVADSAVSAGLPLARRAFTELAIEEVLVNIYHHAYHDHSGWVEVVLRQEPGQLVIEVADEGPPSDPTAAASPRSDLPPRVRPVGGWGLQLIRRSVDELRYRRELRRNVLYLICYL